MSETEWVPFRDGERLPPERRYVLVAIAGDRSDPPSVAVGYLRHQSNGPMFVVPGFGRRFVVRSWCDMLPDGWKAPEWAFAQGER